MIRDDGYYLNPTSDALYRKRGGSGKNNEADSPRAMDGFWLLVFQKVIRSLEAVLGNFRMDGMKIALVHYWLPVLVANGDVQEDTRLYNLHEDPNETTNLLAYDANRPPSQSIRDFHAQLVQKVREGTDVQIFLYFFYMTLLLTFLLFLWCRWRSAWKIFARRCRLSSRCG